MQGFENQGNIEAALVAAKAGNPEAQFRVAMAAFRQGNENDFRHWIQQSAGQEFPPAMFRLGTWRMSHTLSPTDLEDAKGLVKKAANLGFVNAVRAMAVFSLRGAGRYPDWAEGMGWFKKALELNDSRAYREAALLLRNNPGNEEHTKGLLMHAANAGDVIACFHLGCWMMEAPLKDIQDEGLFWLGLSLKGGHVLAARELEPYRDRTLRQPGGNLPDLNWPEIEAKLSEISEPFTPKESKVFLDDPRARTVENVLEKWECDYVVQRASRRLEPAQTSESVDQNQTASQYRTNSAAKFWMMQQDIVLAMIDRKISIAAETPVDFAEDLVVLHYKPGERYFPHCDSFLPDLPEQAAEIDLKGQRIRTILVYLNDDYEEGETYFLFADKKIKLKTGGALIFENITEEGDPDEHSVHEGLSVKTGQKWLASKWIRDKSQVLY
ncbi:MAG: 2OG-Fe(II) oxygenase [Sphingomonadales bacterium]